MLVFGKGCYSKSEFLARHEDLDPDDVDLVEDSCNDKALKALQKVVDATYNNRRKLSWIPASGIANPEKYIASAKEAVEKSSAGNTERVTITDGVHQAQKSGKDGTKVRHFTVAVPGSQGKWHFYLRTNAGRLNRVSSSRTDYVKIQK